MFTQIFITQLHLIYKQDLNSNSKIITTVMELRKILCLISTRPNLDLRSTATKHRTAIVDLKKVKQFVINSKIEIHKSSSSIPTNSNLKNFLWIIWLLLIKMFKKE